MTNDTTVKQDFFWDRVDDNEKFNFCVWLLNRGVSPRIVLELDKLWDKTQKFAGKVYRIGKALCMNIWKFLKEHPAIPVVLGIAICIQCVLSSIPVLGWVLGPVSSLLTVYLGVPIAVWYDSGRKNGKSRIENMFKLAQDFFSVFIDTFRDVTKKQFTQ